MFNFKLSTIILSAFALASVANGEQLEARQASSLANCIFGVTPTGTVSPGANLNSAFTSILNQKLAPQAPQGIITSREARVAGPLGGNLYSVDKPLGAVGNTASQNRAIVSGWLGHTLPAGGTGTSWVINTISCQN